MTFLPPVGDNRITLPLDHVREAAGTLCLSICRGWRTEIHHGDCLVPLLEQRDRLLREQYLLTQVSEDCRDPIKHEACGGCACTCHRHSSRGAA